MRKGERAVEVVVWPEGEAPALLTLLIICVPSSEGHLHHHHHHLKFYASPPSPMAS